MRTEGPVISSLPFCKMKKNLILCTKLYDVKYRQVTVRKYQTTLKYSSEGK
jgi:hypothetical protein